jgi:hypothetical protein
MQERHRILPKKRSDRTYKGTELGLEASFFKLQQPAGAIVRDLILNLPTQISFWLPNHLSEQVDPI